MVFNVCVWLRADPFTRCQPSPLFVISYTIFSSHTIPNAFAIVLLLGRTFSTTSQWFFTCDAESFAFALPFITLNMRQIGLCDFYLNERLPYKIALTTSEAYIATTTPHTHISRARIYLGTGNRTAPLEFATKNEEPYSIKAPSQLFPVNSCVAT